MPIQVDKLEMQDELYFTVKLSGIDSPEEVKDLLNSIIYLPEKDVQNSSKQDELQNWAGYTIKDLVSNTKMVIESFVEYPGQTMIVTRYKGKEIMIPFHKNLINSIDSEEQVIVMDLPEGLLDL